MQGDNKKIYFASDFHLGLQTETPLPREREAIIVSWLHTILPSAHELYLLGDIFDFWWEYKRVVPKGFVRFLATLAEFTAAGIPVHLFTGNHDVWMFDYLEQELGAVIHRQGDLFSFYGHDFYLCHGDGLGRTTLPLRIMRAAFHSRPLQWLFAHLVHPDAALRFGQAWSHHNRYTKSLQHAFRGDAEPVAQFALQHYQTSGVPFYIMGHLHIATIHPLAPAGALTLLGDWISQYTFAALDEHGLILQQYLPETQRATPLASFLFS